MHGDRAYVGRYAGSGFRDRKEAGVMLAEEALKRKFGNPLVLGIPRGGVPVAYEMARMLNAELDIVSPMKLRDPHEPELAIGAVMHDGSTFLNYETIAIRGVDEGYIAVESRRRMDESVRRMREYREGREYPRIEERDVILVDDGIATGATVIVAARWLRKQRLRRLVIAVPVMPKDMVRTISSEADELICLLTSEVFLGVGGFYTDFKQVDDMEVMSLLREYWGSGGMRS